MVQTRDDKGNVKYAAYGDFYAEARIQLPDGPSSWASFWFTGTQGGPWPGNGEIDAVEAKGYDPNYLQANTHTPRASDPSKSEQHHGQLGGDGTSQTQFHVYGVEKTGEKITFYLDGVPRHTVNYSDLGGANPFVVDGNGMVIRLNHMVGGTFLTTDSGDTTYVDATAYADRYAGTGSDMLVDYVRVYSKKPAVEEPEAHLHPQQQRRLSEYLSSSLNDQILITTHSPQILARYTDGRIVRLTKDPERQVTKALSCSTMTDEALGKFGYRLNSITSEVFFSRGVLLVEGPSEVLLYTALSGALGIDLDHLNLSVVSVEGVGFKKYIDVCVSLDIPFIVRTDNDVFKVRKNDDGNYYRYAGVARVADLLLNMPIESITEDVRSTIEQNKPLLVWEGDLPAEHNERAASRIRKLGDEHGIYLALKDLENDLVGGPLHNQIATQYNTQETGQIVKQMQLRKAESMYSFLRTGPDLSLLEDDPIALPLHALVEKASDVNFTN